MWLREIKQLAQGYPARKQYNQDTSLADTKDHDLSNPFSWPLACCPDIKTNGTDKTDPCDPDFFRVTSSVKKPES